MWYFRKLYWIIWYNKHYTLYNTGDIFGNIYTNTFSVSKSSDQSNSYYYYTFGYLSKESSDSKYLSIRKTYFSLEISNGFKHEKTKDYSRISLMRSISCFYTDNNKYICFYSSNINNLRIIVYDNLLFLY